MVIWLLESYSAANEWWAAAGAVARAARMSALRNLAMTQRLYRHTVHESVGELDAAGLAPRNPFHPGQQLPGPGALVADALREIVGGILEDHLRAGQGPGEKR